MWPFGKSTADRVNDAINEQPRLKDLGLQVQERGGTVTVTGMVPNERYVGLINAVAGGINGVKNVDTSGVTFEQQVAAPAQPAPDAPAATVTTPDLSAADEKLDAEVKEMEDNSRVAKAVLKALRGNVELADDPIDVLQSGKSVILRGVVDNEHEQRLAEKLAREVQGVASVDASGLRVAAGAKELVKEKDTSTGDTVYTVKSGDTLGAIAQKYYGNAAEYKKIAHYNNISNPDLIQVGQKIRIPG
ncbi:BON domain-containing protein [Deinococcus aquaticus]|uniref:BON domain-containing protein n=1 Tax=Deinococcus aquaticus TaxID=328692 RepID=A0ABY7V138_9DEIO|nr:BON domain-containing protein [Deinococcus aquaticus]WDA58825.1 BON domain-containing protein [Deinococcus aquaticus]